MEWLRSSARRCKWKERVEEVLNKQDGNMNFFCAYSIACGVNVIQEPWSGYDAERSGCLLHGESGINRGHPALFVHIEKSPTLNLGFEGRLSWQSEFVTFLIPSTKTPSCYIKLGHSRNTSSCLSFANHAMHFGLLSASQNEAQINKQ